MNFDLANFLRDIHIGVLSAAAQARERLSGLQLAKSVARPASDPLQRAIPPNGMMEPFVAASGGDVG
jgi:hypothetical protein